MEYKNETQNCQNCKKDFIIESEDFKYYEKIKVPAPTFCPECRRQRRFTWRNERSLYKRACDLCHKRIVSTYPANTSFPVFCRECWYGDDWDATTYGKEYDFSRPFFEQLKELFDSVPHLALWQRNVINSEYSNMTGESKNVYLSVSVVLGSENIFYSKSIDASSNIFDSYNLKKCENCYENIDGERNYNCQHLSLSRNCIDSYFLIDCANCSNCFMSSNLRNKKFFIRNQQYSEEEYFEKIKEFDLGSRKERLKLISEFNTLCENAIYKFANNIKTVNSTGNNLLNTKNCHSCFDVYESEDSKHCYRAFILKDCMDFDYGESEMTYEYVTGAKNCYNVRFSYSAMENVRDAEYTHSCVSSDNLLACFGIKNKQNVIFNKLYSKEEFNKLREQIIQQMNGVPYVDKKGRVYKYGEFFPTELSPHAYNETVAQDFYPITKMEAKDKGYEWHDPEEKNYTITVPYDKIPDDINEVENGILTETLECEHEMDCNHQCLLVFRIHPDELQFYKKNNIPLPNKCPNCRYYERFAQIPPPKLWHRKCMKEGCNNEFETSYAPERPEKVYCESCYNKEVY